MLFNSIEFADVGQLRSDLTHVVSRYTAYPYQ